MTAIIWVTRHRLQWIEMKRAALRFFSVYCLLAISSCLSGCFGGGEELPVLVDVTGTVTLDGKPLEKARVDFSPQAAGEHGRGRGVTASTDAAGHFQLQYNRNAIGATPGAYQVVISKREGDDAALSPEILPAEYNERTTLTADVTKEGPNEFAFDLKSQ